MIRAEAICVLLALLIATPLYSQVTKTPLAPVPAGQRPALAKRLTLYTDASRTKDWAALYDLVSDANKTLNDGKRMGRRRFVRDMGNGYDSRRLLEFTPVRTEIVTESSEFDIFGCGAMPGDHGKRDRTAVAVRVVREHGDWFFTAWDYIDPRQQCSELSSPAWKRPAGLQLDYMPELTCDLEICTL